MAGNRLIAWCGPLFGLAMPFGAWAADPFGAGDPVKGKALVEHSCAGCHASLFQGDANKIFTRAERKVKNAQQLLGQVRAFSTNTHAGWAPADELDAAAYLNRAFYRF